MTDGALSTLTRSTASTTLEAKVSRGALVAQFAHNIWVALAVAVEGVTVLTAALVTLAVGTVLLHYRVTVEPWGTVFTLVTVGVVEALETDTA